MSDKLTLWLLLGSIFIAIVGMVILLLMGTGWVCLFPWALPILAAEIIGKVRNGY